MNIKKFLVGATVGATMLSAIAVLAFAPSAFRTCPPRLVTHKDLFWNQLLSEFKQLYSIFPLEGKLQPNYLTTGY